MMPYSTKVQCGWLLSNQQKFGLAAESPYSRLGGHFLVVADTLDTVLPIFLKQLQKVDPMYHYSGVGNEFIRTNGPTFQARPVTVQRYNEPNMLCFIALAYVEGRALFELGQLNIVYGATVMAARQNYLDLHPNSKEFEVPKGDGKENVLIRYTGFPPIQHAPVFFEEVTILS